MQHSINVAELAARLNERRVSQGLSIRQCARAVGVPYTTLYRVLRHNRLPDPENLLRLLKWIDVSLEQVTSGSDEPGNVTMAHSMVVHSPGESTPESVALILRADKKLTPQDVEMLMAIFRAGYDGLLRKNDDHVGNQLQTPMAVVR